MPNPPRSSSPESIPRHVSRPDAGVALPASLPRSVTVSPGTLDRLKIYEATLIKWQRAVNLVAPKTLAELWQRHFADSLQIAALIPPATRKLVDLGSGGGFPGLVLAAYFADAPGPAVTLVESDQRKCAFLREAARAMEISVEILSTRIENNANLTAFSGVDVFTARALAPLSKLIAFATPHVTAETRCIFMKGREASRELAEARQDWSFEVAEHASITDSDARILVVRHIKSSRSEEGR